MVSFRHFCHRAAGIKTAESCRTCFKRAAKAAAEAAKSAAIEERNVRGAEARLIVQELEEAAYTRAANDNSLERRQQLLKREAHRIHGKRGDLRLLVDLCDIDEEAEQRVQDEWARNNCAKRRFSRVNGHFVASREIAEFDLRASLAVREAEHKAERIIWCDIFESPSDADLRLQRNIRAASKNHLSFERAQLERNHKPLFRAPR